MRSLGPISVVVAASLLLSSCGNSVYGIRKLAGVGRIDDGGGGEDRACPADDAANPSPADLSVAFFDLACLSMLDPSNPTKARRMLDAGVTLTRMRCNDFFFQRAAGQTRERALRASVAPVSALISGVIGLVSFGTDEGRAEAIQILGLSEAATVAGLEIYESEFLFDSANVISVRRLTMRALDSHAQVVLAEDAGFYGTTRHIIDHQNICTPASILELAQNAIAEGQITRREPISAGDVRAVSDVANAAVIADLGSLLQVDALSADEVGALWWISQQPAGSTIDQELLRVLQARLARLPSNVVTTGAGGTLALDGELVTLLKPELTRLTGNLTNRFQVTIRLLRTAIAGRGTELSMKATEDIHFSFPTGMEAPTTQAVEVSVAPEGET